MILTKSLHLEDFITRARPLAPPRGALGGREAIDPAPRLRGAAEALRPVEEQKARARIVEGAKLGAQITNTGERPRANLPQGEKADKGKTEELLAEKVGLSYSQYRKARKVFETAPEPSDLLLGLQIERAAEDQAPRFAHCPQEIRPPPCLDGCGYLNLAGRCLNPQIRRPTGATHRRDAPFLHPAHEGLGVVTPLPLFSSVLGGRYQIVCSHRQGGAIAPLTMAGGNNSLPSLSSLEKLEVGLKTSDSPPVLHITWGAYSSIHRQPQAERGRSLKNV